MYTYIYVHNIIGRLVCSWLGRYTMLDQTAFCWSEKLFMLMRRMQVEEKAFKYPTWASSPQLHEPLGGSHSATVHELAFLRCRSDGPVSGFECSSNIIVTGIRTSRLAGWLAGCWFHFSDAQFQRRSQSNLSLLSAHTRVATTGVSRAPSSANSMHLPIYHYRLSSRKWLLLSNTSTYI